LNIKRFRDYCDQVRRCGFLNDANILIHSIQNRIEDVNQEDIAAILPPDLVDTPLILKITGFMVIR